MHLSCDVHNFTELKVEVVRGGHPLIIFKLRIVPKEIIYRRKENLSEILHNLDITKIFWFLDFVSDFHVMAENHAIFEILKNKYQTHRT